MNIRNDQLSLPRVHGDPPIPDIVINKSVTMEKKSAAGGAAPAAASQAQQRRERIALAAYYRAERRGFEPGHEDEDWFAAEVQVGGEGL